jgi:Tat protein secretion system quality control protein TatD with DNase activity
VGANGAQLRESEAQSYPLRRHCTKHPVYLYPSDRGRVIDAGLPSGRLLTETDAPFTQVGNRPAAPIDVKETVEALATLRNVTLEDLAQNIRSNLGTLLESAGVTTDP